MELTQAFERKHCKIDGGLNLDIRNVIWDQVTLDIPANYPLIQPSEELMQRMATVRYLDEADEFLEARHVSIEAIFHELCSRSNGLRLQKNVPLYWKAPKLNYSGTIDYLISGEKSVLLVFDGLFNIGLDNSLTIVAEAGCLLQQRLAIGQTEPVFAAVTNGCDFKFFKVDKTGLVDVSPSQGFVPDEEGDSMTGTIQHTLPNVLR